MDLRKRKVKVSSSKMYSRATVPFTSIHPHGNFLLLSLRLKSRSLLPSSLSINAISIDSVSRNFSTSATTSVNPNPPILKIEKKSVSNKLEDALISFNQMLKSENSHSIYRFHKVLGSIAKMGHYETVLSLIKQMQFQGFLVDNYTIGIGINCYCRMNRVDFGFGLLGSLLKRGYVPNVVIFTTLINGLFLENKAYEAVEFFKKLVREKQIEPDGVTYGTVINGLCKSGNMKAAID